MPDRDIEIEWVDKLIASEDGPSAGRASLRDGKLLIELLPQEWWPADVAADLDEEECFAHELAHMKLRHRLDLKPTAIQLLAEEVQAENEAYNLVHKWHPDEDED